MNHQLCTKLMLELTENPCFEQTAQHFYNILKPTNPHLQSTLLYYFLHEEDSLYLLNTGGEIDGTMPKCMSVEKHAALIADVLISPSLLQRQTLVDDLPQYQIWVPTWVGEQIKGLMILEFGEPADETLLSVLQIFAPVLALQIQCAEIQQRLDNFHHALDQHVIMSELDLQGNIERASQAYAKIMGYETEELININLFDTANEDESIPNSQEVSQTIAKGQSLDFVMSHTSRLGEKIWTRVITIPEYDIRKHVQGMTAVMHNITQQKVLEEISVRDELTGLYNRRYFNLNFLEYMNFSRRHQMTLGFLMMDVDHFKKYNDTYGHQMGDQVLKEIAQIMMEVFKREEDHAFRLGGEEFAVMYFVQSPDDAVILAETFRKRIENKAIPHTGNDAYGVVTMSMGLMTISPDEHHEQNDVYKITDEALYRAKAKGRNRLEIVQTLVEIF